MAFSARSTTLRKTTGIAISLIAGIALALSSATAASAASVTVYDDYPDAAPAYPSLGYQATSTSQFGDLVQLGGTARILDSITVSFVDWACESDFDLVDGAWVPAGGPCTTTPGSTFTHPITVNVYAVDDSVSPAVPGAVLATITDDVEVPFRPSATQSCGTAWYDEETDSCNNGYAFDWTFDLSAGATVLTDDIIIAVAYNTQTYGASPLGVPGPYNSLNVTASDAAPTAGSNVDPDSVYWDSTYSGRTAGLRADPDWTGNNPVFRVTASAPTVADDGDELANTGVDSAAMTFGAIAAGGVLVVGAALFGFAAYRKRRIADR